MIDIIIQQGKDNTKIFNFIKKIEQQFKEGIKDGFNESSKFLTQTIHDSFRLPKSGRTYYLIVNGKPIYHRASAPGEAPAILTGELDRSIKVRISGSTQMKLSAGNEKAYYAEDLEYGYGVKPRPYLEPAVISNNGKIINSFYMNLDRALILK